MASLAAALRAQLFPTERAGPLSIGCVTDADLVARARQGDPAAFGELVDRHRTAVYRATLAALGSHHDAEDAAQDAFVAAFQRLGQFRGEASFKTWMLTIAWHEAINRRRKRVRWWRRMVESDREGSTEAASRQPSPEQAAAGDQLRRAIVTEIRALSPKLRDTLLLAQAQELTYDEIAAVLAVPIGTVKWRISEARKKIKDRLRGRGFDVAD